MKISCLEPRCAKRWIKALGSDTDFRFLIALKQALILGEFARVCELLSERSSAFKLQRDAFVSLPEDIRRHVLLHPASIFWIRTTHKRLLHDGRATNLECAAAQFGELLLSAAVLHGADIAANVRLDRRGGLSLPGTGLAFSDLGSPATKVSVRSCRHGPSLRITVNDRRIVLTGPQDTADHCMRRVEFNGYAIEINNRDRRFVDEWIPAVSNAGASAAPMTDDEIAAWLPDVTSSLETLASLDSALAVEAAGLLRCLVPVVPRAADLQVSCSSDEFFGACQVSARGLFPLAEEIAHEFRHNILNAITSFDQIVLERVPGALLYSPWKQSFRPLHAILHTIYSFQEVLALSVAWMDRSPDDPPRQQLAALHSARLGYLLTQLRAAADLTDFGRTFIDCIDERVQDFIEITASSWPRFWKQAEAEVATLPRFQHQAGTA